MKKLLLATLVGMVAATAPLPAHGDGPGYSGSCHIAAVNGTTPGSQNVWNGQVDIAVAVTTPGDAISAAGCSIRVNGGIPTTILTAPLPAPAPTAAAAGHATFTAAVTDTVELCTHVTTIPFAIVACVELTMTPICLNQACGPAHLSSDPVVIAQVVADRRHPGDLWMKGDVL